MSNIRSSTSNWKRFKTFIKHVYREWQVDGTLRVGAGLAYYGTIALIPYLVIIIVTAALIFSPQEIFNAIADFAEQLFGGSFDSSEIRNIEIEQVDSEVSTAVSIIGLVSFIATASFFMVAIQDAINVIWKNSQRLSFEVSRYFFAFVVMLGGAATFTAAIGVKVIISALRETFTSDAFVVSSFFTFMYSAALLALLTVFFMLLYKLLVKVRVDTGSLFVSSLITAFFMMLGEYGLSVYLSNFSDFSYYGAIGAYLVILVTIYYMAQIFLVGAQTGKVLSYRHGNKYLKKSLEETDPRLHPKLAKSKNK